MIMDLDKIDRGKIRRLDLSTEFFMTILNSFGVTGSDINEAASEYFSIYQNAICLAGLPKDCVVVDVKTDGPYKRLTATTISIFLYHPDFDPHEYCDQGEECPRIEIVYKVGAGDVEDLDVENSPSDLAGQPEAEKAPQQEGQSTTH